MISPQFRAILYDGDNARERPLQMFGNSLPTMEEWALTVLAKAPEGAAVTIYQTVEQQIKLIPKPTEKAK